jgi:hypothetical protein
METIANELNEVVHSVSQKLAQIGEAQASKRPAAGEWSQKEILGHLIDSAANNHQRFVRLQIDQELVFPGYAQEQWVLRQVYNDYPWKQLIDFWKAYNQHLLWIIKRIPAEMLARQCTLGDNQPVTLSFLVEDYLRHLKVHVEQLGI